MGEYASFLPLIAIAVLFWLIVIRPQARRQKALREMQDDLQPGQRVMLTSGIFGTVRSLTDDRVRLELSPGVEIEVMRAAIGQRDEPTATTPEDNPGAGDA